MGLLDIVNCGKVNIWKKLMGDKGCFSNVFWEDSLLSPVISIILVWERGEGTPVEREIMFILDK